MKGDRMKKEKYETCVYVKEIGQIAVYVIPGCPRASKVKGHLVSSKDRCRECRSWEGKETQE